MTVPIKLQLVPAHRDAAEETLPATDTALYRRYAPYVARIGFRLLGREDEVDDLIQDVFLVAFRQRDQLRDPGAIKGWLATIAVRTARRRLRMRRLRSLIGLDSQQALAFTQPGASPEQEALLGHIYSLLDQVGVERRLAWTLRHVEGERLDRVAQRCGCSLATAKRRIAAAEAFLNTELSDD